MFQLPPGMSYKQFQAAGMPGYKSDALPYKEGGYINDRGGSVRGGRQPPPPVNVVSRTPNGGYINDRGGYTGPSGSRNTAPPPMPRYDQAQPVQQPSQGTPYGAFDQGRWQIGPGLKQRPDAPTSPPPAQPSQGRSNPYDFYDANGNAFGGTISFKPGTSGEERLEAYKRFANDSGFFSPGTAPPTMAPPQKREWGDVVLFNGQQGSWNGGQQFGGFNPWQQPQSFPNAQRPFANGGTPQGFLPGTWAY